MRKITSQIKKFKTNIKFFIYDKFYQKHSHIKNIFRKYLYTNIFVWLIIDYKFIYILTFNFYNRKKYYFKIATQYIKSSSKINMTLVI